MPKYSVTVAGHSTSISLEKEFWDELSMIAKRDNMSINQLVSRIDKKRVDKDTQHNLSSALRLYVLTDLKDRLHNNR